MDGTRFESLPGLIAFTGRSSIARLAVEICNLAVEAGGAINKVRNKGAASQKSDGSPVTPADLAADHVIEDGLFAIDPEAVVVSEEGARRSSSRFWLVDPLDGTKEYLSGSANFTVNIALVEDGHLSLGVVYAPALHELFVGGEQFGSVKYTTAGPKVLRIAPALAETARVAVSASHLDRETIGFLSKFDDPELIRMGSSLKFCRVADGTVDFYPRFGRTMEWDTGAGQAVLEGAGGCVLNADTKISLNYGKKDFVNPSFLASQDSRRAESLLGAG